MKFIFRKRSAFTLTELLVTFAVIGILFTAMVFKSNTAVRNMREDQITVELKMFQMDLTQCMYDAEGFTSLTSTSADDVEQLLDAYLGSDYQIVETKDTATVSLDGVSTTEYNYTLGARDPYGRFYSLKVYPEVNKLKVLSKGEKAAEDTDDVTLTLSWDIQQKNVNSSLTGGSIK